MVLGSNRGLETNYHEALQGLPQYRPRQIMKETAKQTFIIQLWFKFRVTLNVIFRGFPQSLQENTGWYLK